jgi:hypothetical protein
VQIPGFWGMNGAHMPAKYESAACVSASEVAQAETQLMTAFVYLASGQRQGTSLLDLHEGLIESHVRRQRGRTSGHGAWGGGGAAEEVVVSVNVFDSSVVLLSAVVVIEYVDELLVYGGVVDDDWEDEELLDDETRVDDVLTELEAVEKDELEVFVVDGGGGGGGGGGGVPLSQLKSIRWTPNLQSLPPFGDWKVTVFAPPHWVLATLEPSAKHLCVCLQVAPSGMS